MDPGTLGEGCAGDFQNILVAEAQNPQFCNHLFNSYVPLDSSSINTRTCLLVSPRAKDSADTEWARVLSEWMNQAVGKEHTQHWAQLTHRFGTKGRQTGHKACPVAKGASVFWGPSWWQPDSTRSSVSSILTKSWRSLNVFWLKTASFPTIYLTGCHLQVHPSQLQGWILAEHRKD